MQAEYITLNGRVTIKKGVLTEKKLKRDDDEGLTRTLAFLALLMFLGYCIYRIATTDQTFRIVGTIAQAILVLVWLSPHITMIYRKLFVLTWKSYFPLDAVQSISTKPRENTLETEVTLHLKNGRKKILVFRNAEHQAEAFIQEVEMHLQTAGAATLT